MAFTHGGRSMVAFQPNMRGSNPGMYERRTCPPNGHGTLPPALSSSTACS